MGCVSDKNVEAERHCTALSKVDYRTMDGVLSHYV
jgi:hypothetical protein